MNAPAAEPAEIPCGIFRPLGAASGFLDVEFKQMSGAEETIRLFAAGQPSVAGTLTVSLPSHPVISFIDLLPSVDRQPIISGADSFGHPLFNFSEGSPLAMLPDDDFRLVGSAFLPNPVLWIGSTRMPVISSANQNVTFTVPSLFPEGVYPMFLTKDNGQGNTIMVRVRRPTPSVAIDPKLMSEQRVKVLCEGGNVIIPGKQVQITGFFLRQDTVWIGSTVIPAHWVEGRIRRFQLEFTAPDSLTPGTYPLYVTNELGKTTVGNVVVGQAE